MKWRRNRVLWLSGLIFLILGCHIGHGLKPTGPKEEQKSSISGTVFFQGSWPDSTEEVRVIVYAKFPTDESDFYNISAWSDTLARGVFETRYTLELKPGTYELIMVVLRKKGEPWGTNCFAGMYCSPSDPTHHGVVTVEKGRNLVGIDITVDLSRVGILPPELEEVFGQKEQ